MRQIQLRDAKASFSSVVEQAAKGETTVVTRNGRPTAVIIGYEEWRLLQGERRSFADILLSFPDVGEIERDPGPTRDLGR